MTLEQWAFFGKLGRAFLLTLAAISVLVLGAFLFELHGLIIATLLIVAVIVVNLLKKRS